MPRKTTRRLVRTASITHLFSDQFRCSRERARGAALDGPNRLRSVREPFTLIELGNLTVRSDASRRDGARWWRRGTQLGERRREESPQGQDHLCHERL